MIEPPVGDLGFYPSKTNNGRTINVKEFIARTYYLISVEIGMFNESDLITVLEDNMTLKEFEKWLDEYNEHEDFQKWLDENGLKGLWNE